MRRSGIPWVLASCATAGLAVLGVAGQIEKQITDNRRRPRWVHGIESTVEGDRSWVSVPRGGIADHPGRLSLLDKDSGTQFVLESPDVVAGEATTRRQVVGGGEGGLRPGEVGAFGGHLGRSPSDFGIEYEEIALPNSWVWRLPGQLGSGTGETWAIHVHGLGTQRSQTLRSVATLAELGVPSLVPTYGTSHDNEQYEERTTLGNNEWRQLHEVRRYALSQGADRIIYVGWSIGAAMVTRLAAELPPREVAGLILIAPALDLGGIAAAALNDQGIPRPASDVLARLALGLPKRPSRGANGKIRSAATRIAALQHPTLILAGEEDRTVPFNTTQAFLRRTGWAPEVIYVPEAHHTLEYNAAPGLWRDAIAGWVHRHAVFPHGPTNDTREEWF